MAICDCGSGGDQWRIQCGVRWFRNGRYRCCTNILIMSFRDVEKRLDHHTGGWVKKEYSEVSERCSGKI